MRASSLLQTPLLQTNGLFTHQKIHQAAPLPNTGSSACRLADSNSSSAAVTAKATWTVSEDNASHLVFKLKKEAESSANSATPGFLLKTEDTQKILKEVVHHLEK